jgi:uncharacterized protein (DUF58 family)
VSRARDLAVAGALLCVLAAAFAAPALYIPGIAMLLVAGAAPAWVALSAARARVTLRADLDTAQEGESVPLTVTVRRGIVPFPGVKLVPWPGASDLAPPIRRHSELTASAVVSRRGRRTLGPARLRVADPLGICARELLSGEHQVLVLPRVYPIRNPALRRLDDGGDSPLDAALELDSLRPHSPGAAASRIHWPTVARTGALMERGFTAESDPRVLVMLDAQQPESAEALDSALRAAASLCVHLARRGGCLLLLPGDRRASAIGPDLRSWPALHARLALVQPGGGLARGSPSTHRRTVLYVTASATASPAVRGECYRVGPRAVPGLEAAFTVAGCTGQLVSSARRARSA